MTVTFNLLLLQPIVALIAAINSSHSANPEFCCRYLSVFIGVTGLWPHLLSALPHWH